MQASALPVLLLSSIRRRSTRWRLTRLLRENSGAPFWGARNSARARRLCGRNSGTRLTFFASCVGGTLTSKLAGSVVGDRAIYAAGYPGFLARKLEECDEISRGRTLWGAGVDTEHKRLVRSNWRSDVGRNLRDFAPGYRRNALKFHTGCLTTIHIPKFH